MPACSFCKKHFENPRGLTLFTNDGRSIFYCSSKCRRNSKLGRDGRKVNWVRKKKKGEREISQAVAELQEVKAEEEVRKPEQKEVKKN